MPCLPIHIHNAFIDTLFTLICQIFYSLLCFSMQHPHPTVTFVSSHTYHMNTQAHAHKLPQTLHTNTECKIMTSILWLVCSLHRSPDQSSQYGWLIWLVVYYKFPGWIEASDKSSRPQDVQVPDEDSRWEGLQCVYGWAHIFSFLSMWPLCGMCPLC